MDLRDVINNAQAAASSAQDIALSQRGEGAYCGFAWVEIPDGRSPLVKQMKAMGVGDKHWKKGWQVWSPGKYHGQSMDIHEVGARAYAKALRDCGYDAHAASRPD
jgi:hypothetical protein